MILRWVILHDNAIDEWYMKNNESGNFKLLMWIWFLISIRWGISLGLCFLHFNGIFVTVYLTPSLWSVCGHYLLVKTGSMSATKASSSRSKINLLCQTLLVDRASTFIMVSVQVPRWQCPCLLDSNDKCNVQYVPLKAQRRTEFRVSLLTRSLSSKS